MNLEGPVDRAWPEVKDWLGMGAIMCGREQKETPKPRRRLDLERGYTSPRPTGTAQSVPGRTGLPSFPLLAPSSPFASFCFALSFFSPLVFLASFLPLLVFSPSPPPPLLSPTRLPQHMMLKADEWRHGWCGPHAWLGAVHGLPWHCVGGGAAWNQDGLCHLRHWVSLKRQCFS